MGKFAFARTALKYGLMALNLGRGDKILIPQMICDVVLHPLQQLGIQPVYYEVEPYFSPQWEKLESVVNEQTKAIFMVHYFGQPQDVGRFQDFARKHRLFLIEDNAHGHGSLWQGKFLGTYGDIGITSPRKTFSIPHGAYLFLNNYPSTLPEFPALPVNFFKQQIKSRLKTLIQHYPALDIRKKIRPPYEKQGVFLESEVSDWAMNEKVHQYMNKQDLAGVLKIRQQIYHIWEAWTSQQGLKPLFPKLFHETVPMIFAAYTQTQQESIRWFEWGFQHGIDVHSWPSLPPEIVRADSQAMRYWERLVCFPIHQEMNPEHLVAYLKKNHSPFSVL
ncbi:MAG: DegT/DnrJ/EryC1/StrS family aminotransferase [SAR324 cluster bacterium]|nr:DegT/DnrJ/EryC1/StrS family aminotransferase [SAR324 cluster bacterium]